MLNIYVGQNNLPKEAEFVFDTDAFCSAIRLKDDGFIREVLTVVEGGSYLNDRVFEDRFGGALYADQMSTSAKILIAVHLNPDYIFNCDEIGYNAIDMLLKIERGNIFFTRQDIRFSGELCDAVTLNGNVIEDIHELNYLMGEFYEG